MIDFRYHLVSLISVFLALAVGVVLGAGPLQNSLGTALNDQVTALRADRNAIQARLEATETAVNERDSYIEAAAAAYLPGTLEGRDVVLAVLPGTEGKDLDALSANIKTAGGRVVGRVSLTSAWVDSSRETFRSTYAGQFVGYLSNATSADGNRVLGQGLGKALTASDSNAITLMDLLTASDTPLVTVDAKPSGPASMVAVVGPRGAGASGSAGATPTSGQDPSAWAGVFTGLAQEATTVVVGSADSGTDLVATLRSAGASVTTIDSVGQATAAVSTPLALAAAAAGTTGAYGFDSGAESVMPPVKK